MIAFAGTANTSIASAYLAEVWTYSTHQVNKGEDRWSSKRTRNRRKMNSIGRPGRG